MIKAIIILTLMMCSFVYAEDKIVSDDIGGEIIVPENIEITVIISEKQKDGK